VGSWGFRSYNIAYSTAFHESKITIAKTRSLKTEGCATPSVPTGYGPATRPIQCP
jgi:hypothetical protein